MSMRIVQGIARAVLIAAGIVLVTALILTVIGWRLMMWPYRSTHRDVVGHRAKLEAGLAFVTAAAALWATVRSAGGTDAGRHDQVAGPREPVRG